jgi:hypothetical protein
VLGVAERALVVGSLLGSVSWCACWQRVVWGLGVHFNRQERECVG